MESIEEIFREKRRILEGLIEDRGLGDIPEDEFMDMVERTVFEGETRLSLPQLRSMVELLHAKTRSRIGIVEKYARDERINEIMINGIDRIFVERGEGMERLDISFDSVEELEEIMRNIASEVRREINEMNPILDARLDDGSRVNAVYRNVALDGPSLTIRKFARDRITMDEMVERGTLTQECASYLKELVRIGYNIFISGGTSSGKTTFLNALSDYIPANERVIVIEDSRELMLPHIENIVQMECHNANSLGKGSVSMDMLIRTSLRMRPDRIVVGEVRGGEVSDMLQAFNTGHDGSLSTGHGNSVQGMLRRLESMYLMASQIPMDAIRAQILEGVDIMIHLGRLKEGRKVLEVKELVGYEAGEYVLNSIFEMDEAGALRWTENPLKRRSKLMLKGSRDERL